MSAMSALVAQPTPVIAVSNPPKPLPRDRTYADIVVGLVAETVSYSYPTPPIRRTEFDRVGKSYRSANPHQWIFQGWNDEEQNAIVNPNGFAFPSFPSAMVIPGSPHPGMLPTRESVVVIAPPRGSWGAKSTITPLIGVNENYLKLM